jgi:serine protease Do
MSIRKSDGYRLLAVLGLVAAVGLGFVLERQGAIGDEPAKRVNPTTLRYAEQLSEAFHNAVEVAMPSVVTIHSKTKAQPVAKGNGSLPRGDNPFKGTPFEQYFNDRGFEGFQQSPTPRREGMGSGVIIDPSGIVLTNNHVVEGADEVVVHLADGREFKADDIKTDPHSDLAVIRIHGAGSLPAASLGNSDKLHIGDWVMAIGSPFALDQTVSAGIISGTGRELSAIRAKFLQTDAAINPGNSGGPLINLEGEVVGINTAIATNNGSFNGIGFAIPANLAKWITGQLIKQGTVQRAYLGVGISPLTADLAEKLGTTDQEGVAVTQVNPDTPAAAAGFEPYDVITRFGGKKVDNPRQLQELVERVPLDAKQDVEVMRKGKTMTLSVTPRAMPMDEMQRSTRNGAYEHNDASPSNWTAEEMGVEVTDLTAEQAKEAGVKSGGVLIANVDPGKAGAEAGLRPGMMVLKVDRTPVKNVEEFKTAMKDQSVKNKILLHVQVIPGQFAFIVVK